jgi:hypothetical protein
MTFTRPTAAAPVRMIQTQRREGRAGEASTGVRVWGNSSAKVERPVCTTISVPVLGWNPAEKFANGDTPSRECDVHACSSQGVAMSDFGRRASRAQNAPTVLLQGRVLPETRQAFKDAAEASGVSVAYYLDALARSLVADNGAMPLVEDPRRLNRVELPIPAA